MTWLVLWDNYKLPFTEAADKFRQPENFHNVDRQPGSSFHVTFVMLHLLCIRSSGN